MANSSSRRRRQHFGQPLMPPLVSSAACLVTCLIGLAGEIAETASVQKRKPKKFSAQSRNASSMIRRVKILLMLFEEVRETSPLLPPPAVLCFADLHLVLLEAKLLLQDCLESSRMWLLFDHRRLSEGFHRLTQSIATALEILPMSLLDVSCEVREQVDLVQQQARKAQIYVDPKEQKLWLEVQALMAQIERKEMPDAARLMEVFSNLELMNAKDCQREIRKLEGEEEGEREVPEKINFPVNDFAMFVRYGRYVLYGVTDLQEEEEEEDMTASVPQSEFEDVTVPEDFRCPISLDLMTDPVIIATGQTYERQAIARWIEDGHQTCPKSGLMMAHTVLTPNHALRSLIRQWGECNRIDMPSAETAYQGSRVFQSTPTYLEATKLTVEFLLRQLPSASIETQRHIAGELRFLAKCGSDNRKVIADAGAVPLLIPLLSVADARTQEHAVTAILNLSIFPPNKTIIVEAGAVDYLIKILCGSDTSEAARENAAAALFSISQVTDYAALLGEKSEAISGLLQLLCQGSFRGRRDAASALYKISAYSGNRAKLVKAGAVGALLGLLSPSDSAAGLQDEALTVLALLARSPEGYMAIADSKAVPLLIEVLQSSSPKAKENAVSILLNLCRYIGRPVLEEVMNEFSIMPSLDSLVRNGTPRAKRKASSLMQTLYRWDASPITPIDNS